MTQGCFGKKKKSRGRKSTNTMTVETDEEKLCFIPYVHQMSLTFGELGSANSIISVS